VARRAWALGVASMLALVLVGYASWRSAGGGPIAAARAPADPAASVADAEADGVRARDSDSAARRVLGRVIDGAGEPVEAGTVSLRCLDDDDALRQLGLAIALDESGAFEGPGCVGTVCAELHHPTLMPAHAWVLEPGKPIELRASELPRLAGTVEDRRGTPVSAARISFVAADPDAEGIVPTRGTSTSTDDDGAFAIALVRRPPCDPCTEASVGCDDAPLPWVDRVAVLVLADGFAPARVELDVDPETYDAEPITVRLGPPADTLSGTLTDPGGVPYPRAQVLARSRLRPAEQHHAVPSGDTFAFEALGDGPYDLRALQDGVELATAQGALAGEDVELHGDRVAIGPDVIVEVLDHGRPLAGVSIDGGPFRGARTDMHGQVRAEQAMPGPYALLLRPRGARSSRHEITIDPAPALPGSTGAPTIARIEIELPTR
jgi:hypothetical protein